MLSFRGFLGQVFLAFSANQRALFLISFPISVVAPRNIGVADDWLIASQSMAKKLNHVWGLELGQCALKALRCHLEGDQVVADLFDFVEYPKILSQPEAEPEMLVKDAIEQFVGRNDLKGARVAISVPGQSGLAKFFKPPPVEVKKIPDIVKYEAKQQIPFDLNDVIWDFQQMPGSNIEDGYALESEVGLFAMKKEAVYRALKPFRDGNIDVDLIQLAPVSVYNMVAYDRFAERMSSSFFDPDAPPPSTVVLSMGTDASDLVVTSGFRIWQRNIPIGGNHFTRQLLKDLKLTFAKAEHLKRNVMQSDDPKLVFQVMRPVFNDLVTEIQRSIGFFRSLNKKAEIESIVILGNTARLPGLVPFMNKNLGMEVKALDKFERLSGSEVIGQPAFKENQAGFGVVYGLCLQMLKQGPMQTNLLPREIVVERLIRAKKPWALGALSAVLLGIVANYATVFGSYKTVAPEKWSDAENAVTSASSTSQTLLGNDQAKRSNLAFITRVGAEVSSNGDRRTLWLELLRALQGGLMYDEAENKATPIEKPYTERKEFHLTRVDSAPVDDLSRWFRVLSAKYEEDSRDREALVGPRPKDKAPANPIPVTPAVDSNPPPPAVDPNSEPIAEGTPPSDDMTQPPGPDSSDGSEAAPTVGPSGPGWVIEIEGFHYFNGKKGLEGEAHIRKYLLEYLENGTIDLPGPDGKTTTFSLKELGISYPVISQAVLIDGRHLIPNPEFKHAESILLTAKAAEGSNANPAAAKLPTPDSRGISYLDLNGRQIPSHFVAPKAPFVVQFAWQEKTMSDRMWWRQQPGYDKYAIPPAKK
jgi:type IV pilus assembly protein PilM